MSTELQPVTAQRTLPPTVLELPAEQMVQRVAGLANVLKDFVVKQGLSSKITGREYAHVDAWSFMGTMLGLLAKERAVERLKDGSYIAFVDLVSMSTGHVVGGASALCSVQEKRWGQADEFAVRSMAITRATGKAYRLNFGWVMKMAGYEPTFEEDMPSSLIRDPGEDLYDPENATHKAWLFRELTARKVPPSAMKDVSNMLRGRPERELEAAIAEVRLGTPSHADS